MYLRIGPLVAEGRYHFIYNVMQPEYVRVRLEVLPIIAAMRETTSIKKQVKPSLSGTLLLGIISKVV